MGVVHGALVHIHDLNLESAPRADDPTHPTCGADALLPSCSRAMPKVPPPKAAHADRPERERKVLHELHDKKPGHVPRGPSWLKHHPHGLDRHIPSLDLWNAQIDTLKRREFRK